MMREERADWRQYFDVDTQPTMDASGIALHCALQIAVHCASNLQVCTFLRSAQRSAQQN
jgi:hypothetical protein